MELSNANNTESVMDSLLYLQIKYQVSIHVNKMKYPDISDIIMYEAVTAKRLHSDCTMTAQ